MALQLRSQRQIQTDILNAIIARLGLTDVNPGSILDVLTQAVSQEDFNQYVQMSQIVRLVDLDSTTGEDLGNRAFEYGITRTSAQSAAGTVNVTRDGYSKVSTSFVSAGVLAPSSGDGVAFDRPLRVNDAQGFTIDNAGLAVEAGSQIVIGRGTDNAETRTIATTVSTGTDVVAGVRQDPDNPTVWFVYTTEVLGFNHAFSEEVTFIPADQAGDAGIITINAGTSVSAPATGTAAAVTFEVIADTRLEPGEEILENIDVRALEVGSIGNVGTGNISAIDVEGLLVTNPAAFTTGTDIESDNGLRDRIRSHIQSLSRGTREAVLSAIVGLVDTESSRRVVSANVVLPQDTNNPVKVFIDDGTGFEPTFLSQPSETIISNTSSGTTRLQLDFAPLPKAQIESANSEPFDLSAITADGIDNTLTLNVRVGGEDAITEEVDFGITDFSFPATVRAEEIVGIINDRSTLIEARTSDNGNRIVIAARTDTNENIFVSNTGQADDINPFIQFTNNEQFSLYLYKNDKLLSKDGSTATLGTGDDTNGDPIEGPYNFGLGNYALKVIVDGKDNNPQFVIFEGFSTPISINQAALTISSQLVGASATPSADGRALVLSSNTQFSTGSMVEVVTYVSGEVSDSNDVAITLDANSILGFLAGAVSGTNRDYTLNRELGTIQLEESLTDNDIITAGNRFSRGSIRSILIDPENTRVQNNAAFTFRVDGNDPADDITVTFDDRFSGTYLDEDNSTDQRSNQEFGFDRTTLTDLATPIIEFINEQIYPRATAIVREIGDSNFIEISTNTYASEGLTDAISDAGSIELISQSNVVFFSGDLENVIETNERPHQAFKEGEASIPTSNLRLEPGFEFSPTDSLIVVMDNDTVNGTFVVNFGVTASVSSAGSTDQITALKLSENFETNTLDTNITLPNDVNLIDYYAIFTGVGEDPSDNDPNLATINVPAPRNAIRITASEAPAAFDSSDFTNVSDPSPITRVTVDDGISTIFIGSGGANQIDLTDLTAYGIAAGDIITITSLQNEINNGSFVIQSLSQVSSGTDSVPILTVLNENGIEENGSSGECVLSLKRRMTGYTDAGTDGGRMDFSTEFKDAAVARDEITIIPSTLENLFVQFNNPRLSSLSLSAEISIADNGTRLQVASLAEGSNGYVEVAGGKGNDLLEFNTDSIRGLQGYNYYTGLLSLVHRTIYGDDRDLVTFPGVGAAGVQFQVLAPTVTEIILEIDATLNEGVSIAAVENQVNSAITGYINGLGVGEDVIAEEIRSRTIQISGIRDVSLARLQNTFGSDISNIAVADNEIARISVADITIG